MNGLDIVLFNVISYLGGILSGILIHHKMTKSKKEKDNEEKTVKEPVREKEIIDRLGSRKFCSNIMTIINNIN